MNSGEYSLESPGPTPREVELAETRAKLIELQANLGFSETDEMRELKTPLIKVMNAGDHMAIKDLLSHYQALGEVEVERLEGDAFSKAQIGLIIATGLLWLDAGQNISYGNEMFNAWQYAHNKKFDDAIEILDAAYKEVEETVEESVESEYVGPPTEEIIAICKRELPEELHDELDSLFALPPYEVLEEVASLMAGMDVEENPYEFFSRMGWVEG